MKSFKPDILLLDVMMDVIDGYKVAEHLKGNDKTKFIPIIMITAKSETSDKIKGINCGIDDYLTKPFNSQELLARIRSLLDKREYSDQFVEGEKVKTLRDVVASVNHEINNPLTSVLIAVESLILKFKGDEDTIDRLKLIEVNSLRIKDIIARLERIQRVVTKEYYNDTNILELQRKR